MRTGHWIFGPLVAIGLSGAALAGEQYVDRSGFAASGYDVVAYFDLSQAAPGAPQPPAVPGRTDITATYNGATFAFASEAHRDAFVVNPGKYAPAYDGHCAYGVAKGGKVPGNPNLWRIVDDRLYLNITPNVVTFWEEDIPGNIAIAQKNWSGIEGEQASGKAVPKLDTKAAPVGG